MSLRSWLKWEGEDFVMDILTSVMWPRTSAGTLVVKDGKILALDLEDYLTLPIGGSDKGESFEDTAIRETEEETGLKVKINKRIYEGINSVGGIEVIFSADVRSGELEGNYLEGRPTWVPVEEASERTWRYNRDIEALIENPKSEG